MTDLELLIAFSEKTSPLAAEVKENLIKRDLKYEELLQIASETRAAVELLTQVVRGLISENAILRAQVHGIELANGDAPVRKVDLEEFLATRQNTASESADMVNADHARKRKNISNNATKEQWGDMRERKKNIALAEYATGNYRTKALCAEALSNKGGKGWSQKTVMGFLAGAPNPGSSLAPNLDSNSNPPRC